ncbi:MAG: FAD-dependent monooxygenase [Synechococcaceae cyanobacterium]|nr:FAD-dependent monooxygenase [Synechococcaceae cyanobacterium]
MLISGAGPAGAALALQLVRRGVEVQLIEACADLDRPFRGEALMASGLEALAGLGLDPLPATIPSRRLRGWSFHLDGRLLFDVPEPDGSGPACTLIRQGPLLRALLEQAGRHGGFRYLEGQSVAALLRDGERISGVRLADGRQLVADLVVACDGRSSLIRRLAAIELEPLEAPIALLWFRLEAAATATIAAWLDGRFATLLSTAGDLTLVETASGDLQLGWLLRQQEQGDPLPWPQRWARCAPPELARLLTALPATAIHAPVQLSLQAARASCWQKPGLLLLGDAAHPMSPLRAQGLNMALRDAVVAAALLAEPLKRGDRAGLAAASAQIETTRLREIRIIQSLQAREAGRGALLAQPARRRMLAEAARWIGPGLGMVWQASQRQLRRGVQPLPPP